MNCKQGDLAIIVRSLAGNEGKIVRCLRPATKGYYTFHGPRWRIDRILPDDFGGTIQSVADCALRPIRDQPGTDEMVRIAGLPRARQPAPIP